MKKANAHVMVLVTAKDMFQAKRIARRLVEEKIVSCANIIGRVQSIFWWQGKVEQSAEVLLILKTSKSLFDKVQKSVKACHTYSVPEIIALPITAGNPDYLAWIDASVR